MPRRRAYRHAVLACFVGLVGAWLGMSLFARTTVPIGPFHVELQTGFGRGETVLALPPFGALTADTHLAPVGLSATLVDVGVQRLTDVVNRRGIDGLVADVEWDVGGQLRPLAWRGILAATTGGVAVGLLVFRRRWRLLAMSGRTKKVPPPVGCTRQHRLSATSSTVATDTTAALPALASIAAR